MKKMIVWLAVLFLFGGCINKGSLPKDPLDTTVQEGTTSSSSVNPPKSIVQSAAFMAKDVVSFAWEPIMDKKLDTAQPMYRLTIANKADFPIHQLSVVFGLYGRFHASVDYFDEIPAKTTVTKLFAENYMEYADVLNYMYYHHDNKVTYLVHDPEEITDTTLEYNVSKPKGLVPLVPNAGLTLFAWQDNNTWKFSHLLGKEEQSRDYIPEAHSTSLAMAFQNETNNQTYYYIKTQGTDTQAIQSYVKQQMKILGNYKNYVYVLEGEEDKFSALDQTYAYRTTIVVYEKGTTRCEYTYCAYSHYYTSNPYVFDEVQRNSIQDVSMDIEAAIQIIKQYPGLTPYVVGKNQELTQEQAIEIGSLFLDSGAYPNIENEPVGADKPIIYLYPEKETQIQVSLDYQGTLKTTYPAYHQGWNVIAQPDGTLHNLADNREYSYLFWEGIGSVSYPMDQGFVVKREDTVAFLQEKLADLGLLPKEYNEFIVYWLPLLEEHAYNLIAFQDTAYTDIAKLNIVPSPDAILRVFMTFKELKVPIAIQPQVLHPFERHGFTVIEWGGVELK